MINNKDDGWSLILINIILSSRRNYHLDGKLEEVVYHYSDVEECWIDD